jgi:hypothetical protein
VPVPGGLLLAQKLDAEAAQERDDLLPGQEGQSRIARPSVLVAEELPDEQAAGFDRRHDPAPQRPKGSLSQERQARSCFFALAVGVTASTVQLTSSRSRESRLPR